MSKCTLRNLDFLKSLCKRNRRKHIKQASSDNIRSLTEIAHNALRGNITYSAKAKGKLKRFKHHIRKLAEKKHSVARKKATLIQNGGFLPFLIPPVLSIAGTLAGRYLAKEIGI